MPHQGRGWRSLLAATFTLATVAWSPGVVGQATAAEGTYEMYFPVVGDVYYSDTWGAARSAGRTHDGTDIMTYGVKGLPVVAVASGTVGWMHDEQGGKCCAMSLHHDDGWTSWYIHLNNDTPGTDDGQGWGFAPGITTGVHVEAGQLIGFVGDSGNAENVAPHLHFELHEPDPDSSEGNPINPYEHLLAATVLSAPIDSNQPDAPDWGDGAWFSSVSSSLGVGVGDVNGDGRDDVFYRGLCGTSRSPCWRVHLSSGSGFGVSGSVTDAWFGSESARFGLLAGDFTGDGRVDVAYRGLCGGSGCWVVHAGASGGGFSAPQNWGDGAWFSSESWALGLVAG